MNTGFRGTRNFIRWFFHNQRHWLRRPPLQKDEEMSETVEKCYWCEQPIVGQIPLRMVEPDTEYTEEVSYHEDCYEFGKMLNTGWISWKVASDPGPPYKFPEPGEHKAAVRRAEDFLAELGKSQGSKEGATPGSVD